MINFPNELTTTQTFKEDRLSSNKKRTRKIKSHQKNNNIIFISEISSRMDRIEKQKINDEEIRSFLKQELLLKIETEKELKKKN